LPLAFHLTGGEASDSRNFEILLDLGPDIAPRAAITDKGYDAKPTTMRKNCPKLRSFVALALGLILVKSVYTA